jgi:hypothetical protein
MTTRTKVILAAVVLLGLSIWLLPPLARRIDSAVEPIQAQAAANEARYREMTNAAPLAGEVLPDHPVRRLWEERRAALLASGYIETRDFPMQDRLSGKGAANAFFSAFHSRFPGVECSVNGAKTDQAVVTITARKNDFGPLGSIERFVRQYQPPKP